MFGFFKKKALKENMKLAVQSDLAAEWVKYFNPELGAIAVEKSEEVRLALHDGQVIAPEIIHSLMDINMDLRRVYDAN